MPLRRPPDDSMSDLAYDSTAQDNRSPVIMDCCFIAGEAATYDPTYQSSPHFGRIPRHS
jgi:hypothetical protein